MTEHFHEHRVLTDRDPEAVAYGLVQAFADGDDATLRRLLTAAVTRGPALFRESLTFLVDLAVPLRAQFDAHPLPVHTAVQGLLELRRAGVHGQWLDACNAVGRLPADERAVYLAAAAQLVAGLVDAGHLDVPRVAFADLGSS